MRKDKVSRFWNVYVLYQWIAGALQYRKSPKFLEAQNSRCNHPKIQTKRFYHRRLHPKDAYSIANSEDPDQTAPLGVV